MCLAGVDRRRLHARARLGALDDHSPCLLPVPQSRTAPINRSRMMAPMMTAFSAGTVIGPALGGALAGVVGVAPAIYCVGGVFFFNAMATR